MARLWILLIISILEMILNLGMYKLIIIFGNYWVQVGDDIDVENANDWSSNFFPYQVIAILWLLVLMEMMCLKLG